MKKIEKVILLGVIGIFLSYQANAEISIDRSEFIRVELLDIRIKPTVLVVRDEFDTTQTIRLLQGAKITSKGRSVKVENLKIGDVLFIATKRVLSNIIVSDQDPSVAELAYSGPS